MTASRTIRMQGVEHYRPEALPTEDVFLKQLAEAAGVYVPVNEFNNAQDQPAYLKFKILEQVRYLSKRSSDLSWIESPDRMGQ